MHKMKNLADKKILFIICGGIAAYKSLELIRLFRKNKASIRTILTRSAKKFVTPLSVASLSQGKILNNNCLQCPYHGWEYKNGLVENVPGCPETKKGLFGVPQFKIEILNDDVYICPTYDINAEKGNKAAGGRARKAIGEIKKLVTEYRKASVEESK